MKTVNALKIRNNLGEERKKQLLEIIKGMKADSLETKDSVDVLRELRGYRK